MAGLPRYGALELRARGEHERVVARSPYELDGRGKTVLCQSARQRWRRQAEHVERVREADRSIPDRRFVFVGGRSNEKGSVSTADRCHRAALGNARPGWASRARSPLELFVGDRQAALDPDAHVRAIASGVRAEQVRVDLGHLAHEHAPHPLRPSRRAYVVEARGEREASIERHEAVARLEANDATTPRAGDSDRNA